MEAGIKLRNTVKVTARDPEGNILWTEEDHNIVVNVGLDEILDKFWKGSTYTASHFVGLADGTPTFASGDTMGSHAGWSEVSAYSEAARQDLTLGTVSGQSVDNSASKAVFTINADNTVVGGAFLTTDSTKGGTAGILMAGLAFGADRALSTNDTLDVQWTLTLANA